MDAVSTASTSRLLEAFERMSVSPGEGLVSTGPSPVPDTVSRAFEQLLEQADPPASSTELAGQRTSSSDPAPLSREQVSLDNGMPEKNIVDAASAPAVEAPLISPSELYHLQFKVAMLRLQADTGSQVTQKTTQGLDSLLRNQS